MVHARIQCPKCLSHTRACLAKLAVAMNYSSVCFACRRRGGLVVSAHKSGSRGPVSSPGWVTVLCSWARYFTLTVPLSTQEYKWVPANCQGNLTKYWEVTCDGLASHSGGVAIIYSSRFMLQKPGYAPQ